jgi:hypothetical protein
MRPKSARLITDDWPMKATGAAGLGAVDFRKAPEQGQTTDGEAGR